MLDENLKWLEDSLYFRKLSDEEIARERLLDWVTKDKPPTVLLHAYDDICKVEESTLYADKLLASDVPVEMHMFPKGVHGLAWVGMWMGRVSGLVYSCIGLSDCRRRVFVGLPMVIDYEES